MTLIAPVYRRMFDYLRPYFFPYVVVMFIAMTMLGST
jgi:hypothetical protein